MDRLLRTLCRHLLKPELRRIRGPVFFVTRNFTDLDVAYWHKYDIRWIREEPGALVEALAAMCKAGP